MIPIEKNADAYRTVTVTDWDGSTLEATYPKRARGLVKSGRARFAPDDPNRIILTRGDLPVKNQNLPEDYIMDNASNSIAQDMPELTADKAANRDRMLSYILEKLDRLAEYPAYIDNMITQIGSMPVNDSPMGGEGDAQKAKAIGNAITAREETNRVMIDLLRHMYDDLRADSIAGIIDKEGSSEICSAITGLINRIDPDNIDDWCDVTGGLSNLLDEFRHIK